MLLIHSYPSVFSTKKARLLKWDQFLLLGRKLACIANLNGVHVVHLTVNMTSLKHHFILKVVSKKNTCIELKHAYVIVLINSHLRYGVWYR